jgi:hypothetical protein
MRAGKFAREPSLVQEHLDLGQSNKKVFVPSEVEHPAISDQLADVVCQHSRRLDEGNCRKRPRRRGRHSPVMKERRSRSAFSA